MEQYLSEYAAGGRVCIAERLRASQASCVPSAVTFLVPFCVADKKERPTPRREGPTFWSQKVGKKLRHKQRQLGDTSIPV